MLGQIAWGMWCPLARCWVRLSGACGVHWSGVGPDCLGHVVSTGQVLGQIVWGMWCPLARCWVRLSGACGVHWPGVGSDCLGHVVSTGQVLGQIVWGMWCPMARCWVRLSGACGVHWPGVGSDCLGHVVSTIPAVWCRKSFLTFTCILVMSWLYSMRSWISRVKLKGLRNVHAATDGNGLQAPHSAAIMHIYCLCLHNQTLKLFVLHLFTSIMRLCYQTICDMSERYHWLRKQNTAFNYVVLC